VSQWPIRATSCRYRTAKRREQCRSSIWKLRAGLIRYQRGKITVLDRPRLEARSCECYQVVKTEFDRLLPYISRQLNRSP
jgi:ABC-type taurine transport system ATPase subunit